MAYNGANLSLLFGNITGGFKVWQYDTLDAAATVRVVGYISDAVTRGMAVNDLVINRKTDTFAITFHTVAAVSAAGAADLTDGLAVGVTNTD